MYIVQIRGKLSSLSTFDVQLVDLQYIFDNDIIINGLFVPMHCICFACYQVKSTVDISKILTSSKSTQVK
jgi:hypothetical protein